MSEIDARASVSRSARIGSGSRVGAFAVIGDEVELGEKCVVEPHAVINGPAKIGAQNHFYSFCAIGGEPQDLTFPASAFRWKLARRINSANSSP